MSGTGLALGAGHRGDSKSMPDYLQLANQCLSLAETTTDEQYKSVLLRAAVKLNELADGQECRLSPSTTESEITKPACDSRK